MPSNDITFCTYYDCKFYKSCRRYLYDKSDEEIGNVSCLDIKPRNFESDNPMEYCDLYFGKRGSVS